MSEQLSLEPIPLDKRRDYQIYIVRHKANGMIYVGATTQPIGYRWKQHCLRRPDRRGRMSRLATAIAADGPDSFDAFVVRDGMTCGEAFEWERRYIESTKSDDPAIGYNDALGAQRTGGHRTMPFKFTADWDSLRKMGLELRMVEGTDAAYAVSRCGRVFSRRIAGRYGKQDRWREINGARSQGNYRTALIPREGKLRQVMFHRLVAEAFIGKQPEGVWLVAHADGNPDNNHADNLRWASYAANMSDMRTHGRAGKKALSEEVVRQIRANRSEGVTIRELSRKYDRTEANIRSICNRQRWAHVP